MNRLLRTSLLVAASALLPACVEADVETELKADGSGSFGISMKFTEKFVEIARKMEKLDPKQEALSGMKEMLLEKPDAEALAELEKKGLKLQEFEAFNDEKRIGAKMRVGFRSLSSLRDMDSMTVRKGGKKDKGGSPADDMTLVRNADGTYTLSLGLDPDHSAGAEDGDDGEDAEGPEEADDGDEADDEDDGDDDGDDEDDGEEDDGEDEAEGKAGEAKPADPTPEEAAKKMQEVMPLLAEMIGEAQKLRITVALRVPGEVVEFSPAAGAVKEDGKVSWTLDFQTMMAAAMGGGENPLKKMTVRFRMPEGQSIPEAALWDGGAAKKPATTPAPAAPPVEEEAPAGEPK